MKVILVDDERLLLKDLAQIMSVYKDVEIVEQFTSSLAALRYVCISPPDVAFIDINMPEITGIDLAEKILEVRPDVEIVFITAYDEYAIKAFELNAFDYLLKPVEEDRIEKTIDKLRRAMAIKKPVVEKQDVHVQFFGRFELLISGNTVRWRSRKAQEFVAFLLSRPSKSAQKHVICEALYPDIEEKNSLINIQSTASRARQSLADSGGNIKITYNNDGYQLVMPEFSSDLQEMQVLSKNITGNSSQIKLLFKDGYMAENGWLWSYADAAIWDERLGDVVFEAD
ncbi:MAG: response regulator [Negativicutes bacterium]|jgi:two-component SAPR family response regulator